MLVSPLARRDESRTSPIPRPPLPGPAIGPRAVAAGGLQAVLRARGLAYLALAAAPLLWAGNWVFARLLVARIDPLDITFSRWAVGAVVLLALAWRQERRLPRPDARAAAGTALAGFLGMVAYTLLQYKALQHTQAVNGSLIFTATPAFTLILAAGLLGEPWTAQQVVGIALTLAGVAVILTGGSLLALRRLAVNPGDVMVLLGDWIWAGYTVVARIVTRRLSSLAFTAYNMVAAVVLLLPAQVWLWVAGRSALVPGALTWPDVAALLYIGLFASAGAYVCWNEGVRWLGAGIASVFGNLLPVFTALLAGAFLGERLTLAHVAGAAAVVAGVYLTAKPAAGPPRQTS